MDPLMNNLTMVADRMACIAQAQFELRKGDDEKYTGNIVYVIMYGKEDCFLFSNK